MAENAKPAADTSSEKSESAAWWKSRSTVRWVAAIVAVSILLQGALFLLLRKSATAKNLVTSEYTVGTFAFIASSSGGSRSAPGKFNLHIRFVDDLDPAAHQRLAAHQFRVREAVEGVLRKSHGLELSDSSLTRLKHEVQERIDDALDLRAVAEVIFTDLSTESAAESPPHTENAAAQSEAAANIPAQSL